MQEKKEKKCLAPMLILETMLLCILLASPDIHALDITGRAVETYSRYEYNRAFRHTGDVSIVGDLRLEGIYNARAGLSYGRLDGGTDFKAFAGGGVTPFPRAREVFFRLFWIYNGLLSTTACVNATILPS